MDESHVLYDGWTINTWVQQVCAICLIKDGESLNDGPQVAREAKEINIWNIELVSPSACENEHEIQGEYVERLPIEGPRN